MEPSEYPPASGPTAPPAREEPGVVPDDPREAIRDFMDHLQDRAYVRALLARFGTPTVLALLADLVRAGERDDVNVALLLAENAMRFGLATRDFADAYRRSDLPAVIRQQVYAPDYTVRHLAVHAASRLGPREHGRYLAGAVPWYLAHDPLNLGGLLMELRLWDQHMPWRAHLEAMAAAPLYLTRWAAVELLSEHGASPVISARPRTAAWPRQLLRTLAQDGHPLVRREAQWRLDQRRASRPGRRLPRWRRAKLLERLRQGDPEPTFFKLWLSVSNYLGVTGEPDYDGTLVDAIIEHVQAHPITPGYDIDAYWQPAAAARGRRPYGSLS